MLISRLPNFPSLKGILYPIIMGLFSFAPLFCQDTYFLFAHGSIDVPQEAAAYADSNSEKPYIITGLYKAMSFDPRSFGEWGQAQDIKQLEQEYKKLEGTLSSGQSIVIVAKGRGALALLNLLNINRAEGLPKLKAVIIESPEGNLANLDLYGIPEDLPVLLVANPDNWENRNSIIKIYRHLKWLGLTDVYAIAPENSLEYTKSAHAFYAFYGIPHDAALAQEGVQQLLKALPLPTAQQGQNWAEWLPLVGTLGAAVASVPVLKKIYKMYKRWSAPGDGGLQGGSSFPGITYNPTQQIEGGEATIVMPKQPKALTLKSMFLKILNPENVKELELTADQKAIQTLVQKLEPKLLKIMEIQEQLIERLPLFLKKSSVVGKIKELLEKNVEAIKGIWLEFKQFSGEGPSYKNINDTENYLEDTLSIIPFLALTAKRFSNKALPKEEFAVQLERVIREQLKALNDITNLGNVIPGVVDKVKPKLKSLLDNLLRKIQIEQPKMEVPLPQEIERSPESPEPEREPLTIHEKSSPEYKEYLKNIFFKELRGILLPLEREGRLSFSLEQIESKVIPLLKQLLPGNYNIQRSVLGSIEEWLFAGHNRRALDKIIKEIETQVERESAKNLQDLVNLFQANLHNTVSGIVNYILRKSKTNPLLELDPLKKELTELLTIIHDENALTLLDGFENLAERVIKINNNMNLEFESLASQQLWDQMQQKLLTLVNDQVL
ncbi:MAG TPA: hypothetical protein VHA52_06570, partial [Candidatus Babeliaceae bacterium]|nr:hypothetical protein [Candidatus Babeliaceae bacterium]